MPTTLMEKQSTIHTRTSIKLKNQKFVLRRVDEEEEKLQKI